MTNLRFPTGGSGSFEASKHVYDLNEKGQRIQHDFTTDAQQTFNRRQSYIYNDKAELAVSNATGLLANGTPTTAINADNRQYFFDALDLGFNFEGILIEIVRVESLYEYDFYGLGIPD